MYLALDQGTTSSRAIVFDPRGRAVAQAQHEFSQHFPEPGWVEHDPEDLFSSQWRAAQEAHAAAGSPEIAAVGITNQRETVVVWDRRTGQPVYRAIVWQDRRTADALARLASAGHAETVRRSTGLPLDPYFSAAKIAWILDRVPGARAAAERGELCAGTVDSWLLYRLSDGAVFATEPSNASRTSLYDLQRGDWSDALCALFSVPRACLPEIRDSAGDFGAVAATGWPIAGVLGDQQAALFGHGCLQPGAAKCTYGTGAFLLCQCGDTPPEPKSGVLATVAWRINGRDAFALEGSVLICGALIQWLCDGLGILATAADAEPLARTVPDSGGVVLVPAFAGLGTPHWDPHARGLLIGMTRGTTTAHIVRAAVEAMALQVHDVAQAMQAARGTGLHELRVDGGAARNQLLLEIQAALLGAPVVRPAFLETTALGAFRMAMLGRGDVGRAEDLPLDPEPPARIEPGAHSGDVAVLARAWREAVDRSKGWAASS